ncbi:MAG TPA: thiol-disulfide oxidoreductase, partial [Dehalococcoidia bacterium]|nr:thiol-disulfide oxidoreductase [Dehalococcoidia bacterium]
PGIAERLAAEAEGSPLRARRIDVGTGDDLHEFLFDQGLTDGLPVVPPTPERVMRMLEGTGRDAQDLVAVIPPNMAPATVEKVAINAVMAGCRPEYLPVVITAVEACVSEEFNAHGVWATTMGAAPAVVVNGPIRHHIGMNMRLGALGQGNRANASIGRALRLVMRNVGGAKPGGTERSTLGTPMKYTLSFAEWEERSPWEPMHVEKGFEPDDSVVTVFPATSGPQLMVDQTARTARALTGSLGLTMAAVGHPRTPTGHVLFVVCPEHADTIWRDRWSKKQVREYILEVTNMPLRDRLATPDAGGIEPSQFGSAGPTEEQLSKMYSKFQGPEFIHMVVAGSEAGKFSAVLGGWASAPVSRKIENIP